jgi:Protein of unknown function (DUF4238)
MTARRHHYISQCYFKGFVPNPEKPLLFATDFKTRKTFSSPPENIAAERDFHTVDVPGQSPDIVEAKLGEVFEDMLAPALLRIAERGSIADDSDRYILFFFMAMITIKNPRMRETVGSAMGNVADLQLKAYASDPDVWNRKMARAKADGTIPQDADTDSMRKHILEGNLKYGFSTSGHMSLEFSLIDKILPYFHGRKWAVYRGPADRTTFITSDNPVCLMWEDPRIVESPGLGRRGTRIVFPVANSVAIVGTFEGSNRMIDANNEAIAVINGSILPFVARQVYARGDDFVYALGADGLRKGAELLDDPVRGYEDDASEEAR